MKIKQEIEWVSGESPETQGIKLLSVIESDGTRRTITGYMSRGIWYQTNSADPLIVSGVYVMAWASFPTFEAESPKVHEGQVGRHQTNVEKLIALHETLFHKNPYACLQFDRNRTNGWTAILATDAVDGHHTFTILAKGQGLTPEEAAQTALVDYADRNN